MFEALALVEVSSIARGMVVSDACLKKAAVRLLASRPISPGRYITLFWGTVAEVQESFDEGVRAAGDTLVDKLFLPGAHAALLETLSDISKLPAVDALGIVETFTVASTLLSADAACKAAGVRLLEVRLATGMGGKSYYVVTGELHDVEAAVDAGNGILSAGQLLRTEIIARPAPDLVDFIW
jgi:microcompartment protein CcmL/EutN